MKPPGLLGKLLPFMRRGPLPQLRWRAIDIHTGEVFADNIRFPSPNLEDVRWESYLVTTPAAIADTTRRFYVSTESMRVPEPKFGGVISKIAQEDLTGHVLVIQVGDEQYGYPEPHQFEHMQEYIKGFFPDNRVLIVSGPLRFYLVPEDQYKPAPKTARCGQCGLKMILIADLWFTRNMGLSASKPPTQTWRCACGHEAEGPPLHIPTPDEHFLRRWCEAQDPRVTSSWEAWGDDGFIPESAEIDRAWEILNAYRAEQQKRKEEEETKS